MRGGRLTLQVDQVSGDVFVVLFVVVEPTRRLVSRPRLTEMGSLSFDEHM